MIMPTLVDLVIIMLAIFYLDKIKYTLGGIPNGSYTILDMKIKSKRKSI